MVSSLSSSLVWQRQRCGQDKNQDDDLSKRPRLKPECQKTKEESAMAKAKIKRKLNEQDQDEKTMTMTLAKERTKTNWKTNQED